jgi:general secretion pathway protein G
MKKSTKKSRRSMLGFTLVELMVVVAIIAILTAIITSNFTTAKSRARDSQRISDIANIQLALGRFFDRCNGYPKALDFTTSSCTSNGITVNLNTFLAKIPTPPSNGAGTYSYAYGVDSSGNVIDYVVGIPIENANPSATANSLSPFPTPSGSVTAYTAIPSTFTTCDAVLNYCVGPKQ